MKLAILLSLLVALPANAGAFFSEIGGGWKDFNTTSYILRSPCKKVVVIVPQDNPRWGDEWSCGGDQPVFIGYPIAFTFANERTTIGWFHMSNWMDNDGETHFDCVCVTHRFYWRRR